MSIDPETPVREETSAVSDVGRVDAEVVDPDGERLLLTRVQELEDAGDYHALRMTLTEAQRVMDGVAWPSERLARLHAEQGNLALAEEAAREALRLAPASLPGRTALGFALLQRGDVRGTIALLRPWRGPGSSKEERYLYRVAVLNLWIRWLGAVGFAAIPVGFILLFAGLVVAGAAVLGPYLVLLGWLAWRMRTRNVTQAALLSVSVFVLAAGYAFFAMLLMAD